MFVLDNLFQARLLFANTDKIIPEWCSTLRYNVRKERKKVLSQFYIDVIVKALVTDSFTELAIVFVLSNHFSELSTL